MRVVTERNADLVSPAVRKPNKYISDLISMGRIDVRTRIKPSPSISFRSKGTIAPKPRSVKFVASSSHPAQREKEKVGRITISADSPARKRVVVVRPPDSSRHKGFTWAKDEYIRSGFKLFHKIGGKDFMNRDYLISDYQKWGYFDYPYNGRNWHVYSYISKIVYNITDIYIDDVRRFCGDGYDDYFGWSSSEYLPEGFDSYGTYYYEPNYAFSFTFNKGYEGGYLRGYLAGAEAWEMQLEYTVEVNCFGGYKSSIGVYEEYTDGYKQGYAQGYYAAYCGYEFGWENFGYGDFLEYPIIYDFDYDYLAEKE